MSCDSLIAPLQEGKYLFTTHQLDVRPEMQSQLQGALGTNNPIDSLTTPILNLGGRLFTRITRYDQLLEALEKD